MASPLSNPVYRNLFAAQVIALAGTGLTTVALALLAYDLAGGDAGAVLGTALALKMVAYVGVAPIVGGLAHHIPRRAFLIGLDIGRATIIASMPFVTDVWQVYVLIFLLNAFSAGFTPTFQATIPDILPDEKQYTRALSLSRLAYDLENLLSPSLAAAALAFVSYHTLFGANAIAFLVSAALVFSVQLPIHKAQARAQGILRNITHGTTIYLKTPRLRGLLALSFAASCAGAMVIVNTVVYVRDYLGGAETEAAIAYAAYGGGSMIIALLLPRLLDTRSDRPFMLAGGIVLALGLTASVTSPNFAGLMCLWFVLGIGGSLIQTPAGRLLKRSAHDADRPAIYSAQFALSHAGWLVAYLFAGKIGAASSLSVAFIVLALLALLSTGVAAFAWPRRDPMVVEHTHDSVEHEHLHVHDEHHQHSHEGWEGPEPHSHPHRHGPIRHSHAFVLDAHHPKWPNCQLARPTPNLRTAPRQ